MGRLSSGDRFGKSNSRKLRQIKDAYDYRSLNLIKGKTNMSRNILAREVRTIRKSK